MSLGKVLDEQDSRNPTEISKQYGMDQIQVF